MKIWTVAILTGTLATLASSAETPLQSLSLTQLELRREKIDDELANLAHLSLRSGVGAIGFRSRSHTEPESTEWFQVELEAETPIDQIVLVPNVWRHVEEGFIGDAFPEEFRVIAGSEGETNGTVIASYKADNSSYPGIAPHLIACTNQTAAWIRVEATKLAARHHDGAYVFQLSEMMVFNGGKNEALHRPVTASSPNRPHSRSWNSNYLTDGFTPYLMNAAHGDKSLAHLARPEGNQRPILSIDLGQTAPLSRIHLHAVDQSDTVPQSSAGDLAIPRGLVVQGATRPDFSDAEELLSYSNRTIYSSGPIMMWNFNEISCRYVRFIIAEPYQYPEQFDAEQRVGFAEIEIFSDDRNVAAGKTCEWNLPIVRSDRPYKSLTDGRNLYGKILPVRDWIEQLARRRDLEIERPLIEAELNLRYARQKANLHLMGWLTGLLLFIITIIILMEKIFHQRAVYRIRERIAANLHDELGANLHAIGLLGDLAKDEVDATGSREELDELVDIVDEIRSVAKKTGAAARYCTNMLETPGLYENLQDETRKITEVLLADIEHDFTVEGGPILNQLKRRSKIDLYLFYKECLTNIIRHSGATRASTRVAATEKEVRLTVTDNGRGLKALPPSLKRRARFLRARLSAAPLPEGGTSIELVFRPRAWGRKT